MLKETIVFQAFISRSYASFKEGNIPIDCNS